MSRIAEQEHPTLWPLAADTGSFRIWGRPLRELQRERLSAFPETVSWRVDFWADDALMQKLTTVSAWEIRSGSGEILAQTEGPGPRKPFAADGILIRYPWDLLALHERLKGTVSMADNRGMIRSGCTIDGLLIAGEGTEILPGVYVEGTCIIGKNCKIGPNAYLRGPVCIGDRCHIGQAVELKNCILGDHVSVGHLSYAGDSIFADNVNFGAGTIIGNLRHDGADHRSMVDGVLISTGRRKFGAIIGSGVHTGIHTSIYPGRKLGPGTETRPGEIVSRDEI